MALSATIFLSACLSTSDMLSVQSPNNVNVNVYDDPTNATLMVNGVIGDYECAFGSFVMAEGLLTDELRDATFMNANWVLDRRDEGVTSAAYGTSACTTSTGIYTPLSTARGEADRAITKLTAWTAAQVPSRSALLAQADLYAGFSYANLGMAMCQAAFDLGPLVDQKGIFALAESRFTDAIAAAQAAGMTSVLNAAQLGRARVRLFQHNASGALADAQLVPPGFVFNAAMDATNARRYNHVYNAISTAGQQTVEPSSRALATENGELDPRAAVIKLSTAPADAASPIYIPVKYNAATLTAGQSIPMPIARYAEAQLILAEAQGGQAAVGIINAMRAAVSLKPYTGPTDAASIQTLVASERQRVLFVEGFRAFDVERFGLALNPSTGAAYFEGGGYGGTVCFPLPDIEKFNNPNVVVSQITTGVQGKFPLP